MTKLDARADSHSFAEVRREIVTPHAADVKPVTAVKNGLLLASLDQLQTSGMYERYAAVVPPHVPVQIRASLALNWAPVELALEHYGACDAMLLGAEAVQGIGSGVGDRVQGTSLVSAAKNHQEPGTDLWAALPPMHRMWARYYQGGSAQALRLGPKEMEVELLGFVLNKFRYFRQGQLAVINASFAAVGVHLTSAKIVSFSAVRDELVLHFAWV